MGVKVYSDKTNSFIVHDGYKGDEAITESVKAGSVFKKNGKAVGVFVNDVDVDGEQRTASVMFDGWVNPDLLNDTADNINALQNDSRISFRFYEGSAFSSSSSTNGTSASTTGASTTGTSTTEGGK